MKKNNIIIALIAIMCLNINVSGQKVKKPKPPKDTVIVISPVDSVLIEAENEKIAKNFELLSLQASGSVIMMVTLPDTYNYYVAKDGSDSNPGTDEEPFVTIQHAIDVANPGESIKVKEGIYYENLDYKGKSIKVVGSPENPRLTTIDGGGITHVVQMIYKENTSTLLSGFTITNGKAIGGGDYHSYYGGGIYLYNNAKPTLSHLIIRGNVAYAGGALAALHSASPTLENVLISDNTASYGSVAYFYNSVYPILYNVTATGNITTNNNHGTFYLSRRAYPNLYNSIVWNTESNYEISFNPSSSSNGPCTITFIYSDKRGGKNDFVNKGTSPYTMEVTWSTGSISDDPLFTSYFGKDFNLTSSSPCIDAGDPSSSYYDINFPPSQGTERNDMGAYGGPSTWLNPNVRELNEDNLTDYQSDNYIFTKTTLHKTSGEKDYQENLQYFDGLGRLIQTIDFMASPEGKDIIQPIEYDPYGREALRYLPYASGDANGFYRSDWKTQQSNFYTTTLGFGTLDGDRAYTETVFDNSPLNRIMKQGAPGDVWKVDNTTPDRQSSEYVISNQYSTNTSSDSAYYWTIDETSYPDITFDLQPYSDNQLYKTIVSDENNNPVAEFKDKQDKVVLKTDAIGGKTYYIYDDFDLLRCVIPPLASQTLNKTASFTTDAGLTVFNELCYYYEYDYRRRMTKKKLPGTVGFYEMTYDLLDRLTETIDPEGNKTYIDYDIFSRPIETGIYINEVKTWLTKTAYGTYTLDDIDYSTITNYEYHDIYGYTKETTIKDLVAVTKTKVLDPAAGMKTELVTVTYYDKYGRVIQVVSDNHKNGLDRISHLYMYKNSQLITETRYENAINGTTFNHTMLDKFEYDHALRLKKTKNKINDQTDVTLSSITYNEIGQLISRNIGDIQSMDYKYNIRNWLAQINNPYVWGTNGKLFNLKLDYGAGEYQNSFNGNIVDMMWSNAEGSQRYYYFTYDPLNRLKLGYYEEWYQGTNVYLEDKYKVSFTYDANGNLLTANRKGVLNDGTGLIGNIDILTYKYYNDGKSNRLWAVGDDAEDVIGRGDFTEWSGGYASKEYDYDNNGNMIADANKMIYAEYNLLNLPKAVICDYNDMYFTYSALGNKLSQYSYPMGIDTRYDYIGPFVYKNDVLDYIITGEGRVVFNNGAFNYYEFGLKDHLGNIRVTFKRDGNDPEVLQTNDYYPFGLLMGERYEASGTNKNKYLYNGKERLSELDIELEWYDYGARMYDPQLGRFHTQDAFAEKYINLTPYQYAANNPILFIDVNGDSTYTYNVQNGQLTMISDIGGNENQIVSFVDNEGKPIMFGDQAATVIINGEAVFVTETREGTLVSAYDPLEGLSSDYNSESGYEYTASDLIIRHKAQGTVIGDWISNNEASGYAKPLATHTYYENYVEKWGTDKAFWMAIEEGYFLNILPGASDLNVNRTSYRSSFKINNRIQRLNKPTFNEFRRANKGKFTGYKGRGTSTKAQWEEYKRLYGK